MASETAQLLLEAAEIRQRAVSSKNEDDVPKLFARAEALKRIAAKREQRLRWWRPLQQRECV